MSRYLLLFLLNLPLILLAILGAITQFKLKRITKSRLIAQIIIWILLMIGLASSEYLYNWLFAHKMTQTEPLSLFDVIQITAIIIVFYIANHSRTKIESLEKRIQDLHQELSIKLSDTKKYEKNN